MKHSSVAPDGLSSSTFSLSGLLLVSASMFDSHLSISRNDFSAIAGGGPMFVGTSAPSHVQMSWFACVWFAASSRARRTYEW